MARRVAKVLDEATRRLADAGSASARLDASLLLQRATGWSRTELLAHPERLVPDDEAERFEALVQRREAGEPVAYVLAEREFYGRVFRTDARALVPRPETEKLVEIGIQAVRRWRWRGIEPRVVDVGTGSGAIAISVAAETGCVVVGTDISRAALELARENARALRQQERLRLMESDLLGRIDGPVHVLLANLPYLPDDRALPRDVAAYEPRGALRGGAEGTELVERLLREAVARVAPAAELALEIDEGQGASLSALAADLYAGAQVNVLRDGAGFERVLWVGVKA